MSRHFATVEDYRAAARRRLPKMVFDYIDGGAGEERGLSANLDAFRRRRFNPKRLVDVSRRDISVTPFETRWGLPFAIAPMGLNGVTYPDADLILAKAAQRAGIPFCLSTASTSTIEEVAAVSSGELWFQLYVVQRNLAGQLVERAESAGCTTLILTVDVAVNGERIRDKRSGFGVPFKYTPKIVLDAALHPQWALRQVLHGLPDLAHFRQSAGGDIEAQAALMGRQMDAAFDWDALAELRQRWKGRLLVKGILRADDARKCAEIGVDGVILSNHGGRQLEDVSTPIDMLEAVGREVSIPLMIDSGVRTGADVVKSLALGASAVLVGRPFLYALAANGAKGVDAYMDLLRHQIDNSLALIGVPRADEVSRDALL